MFDADFAQEIAIKTNSTIISALTKSRQEQLEILGGSDLYFEVDYRLAACFTDPLNKLGLKALIKKDFKGPLHKYDFCEFNFFKLGQLDAVWHITMICKKTRASTKRVYYKSAGIGNLFDFKVTAYRACDFSRITENY